MPRKKQKSGKLRFGLVACTFSSAIVWAILSISYAASTISNHLIPDEMEFKIEATFADNNDDLGIGFKPEVDINVNDDNYGNDDTYGANSSDGNDNDKKIVPRSHNRKDATHNIQNHTIGSKQNDYLSNRPLHFDSWHKEGSDKLLPDADANGTIIDFVIAGFPKCGTTTLEANLGYIAPIPIADVCTPVHQTVHYAYKNWPQTYTKEGEVKLYRGTKCPAYIHGTALKEWSHHLPRTKIIVGVRHPVLWFQSFWNMLLANGAVKRDSLYDRMEPCKGKRSCDNGCPGQILCTGRARFHNALAALGKTSLTREERMLLSPNDIDGGMDLVNNEIRNPVFVYEQKELRKQYVWNELASYLGVTDPLKRDKRENSHGNNRTHVADFCDDEFDEFRANLMPIAYNVSVWLVDYLIPTSRVREDVTIPKVKKFAEIVESYKVDPCKKLKRLDDGTYILKNGSFAARPMSNKDLVHNMESTKTN